MSKTEKCFEIAFSPTGGTKKAADILISGMGAVTADVIDLTDRNADFSEMVFGEGDICVVAMPVFGGRLPQVAAKRLGQIKGNGALAIAVAVYGNRAYEDALLETADILKEKGFKVIAAVATLAEHSIMRRFAAGRPDEEDIKVLEGFGAKIAAKIEADAGDMTDFEIPGNRPYKELKVASLMPEVDGSKCIGCKLCARICPVGAIDEKATTETDNSLCIGCNRCIYYCPKKARSLNPEKLAALEEKVGAALSGRKESELYI